MASSDNHDTHRQTTFRRPSKGRELALGTLPSAILPLNTEPKTDAKSRRGSHNLIPVTHRRRSSLSNASSGGEGPSNHASTASKGVSKRIRGFEVPGAAQLAARSGEPTRRTSRTSTHGQGHRDHREASISSSETSNTSGTVRSGHHRQTSRLLELVQNGTAKSTDPQTDDNGGEGGSSLKTSPPNALPGHVDNAKTDLAGPAPKAHGHQSVMARVKNPGMLHARRARRKSISAASNAATPNGPAITTRHASNAKESMTTKREQDGITEKTDLGSRGPPKGYERDHVTGQSIPYW